MMIQEMSGNKTASNQSATRKHFSDPFNYIIIAAEAAQGFRALFKKLP